MDTLPEATKDSNRKWTLARDIVVLQFKLVVDGLRDLVLVPASLIAGLISLVRSKDGMPGNEFYELVSIGKQSERWINLFGALRNAPPEVRPPNHFGDSEIDDFVSRVEAFVVDEYQKGGVTKQARERMERAMQKMRGEPTPPP